MATVATPSGSLLQSPFVFSYMRRGGANKKSGTNANETETAKPEEPAAVSASNPRPQQQNPAMYETSIRTIAQVATVEAFWETYDYLKRPNELPPVIDYHFFRVAQSVPIKPTWEDPNNANGGKWVVRMPKGLASRYWEEIMLALIGGQFGTTVPENEICGAVLSLRYNEDILGIWNRNANATSDIEKIRMAIQRILQLPPNAHMEYKPHETSLQDRTGTGGGTTSFRSNHPPAQAWKPKVDRASHTSDATSGTSAPTASSGGTAASSTTSSRRSGSWTERDKTLPNKNLPRGSWRS